MSDAIANQVRQVAADIFNLPLKSIIRETSPDTVGGWDSVQHLNFVLALESSCGISLDPEDIEQIRSVGAAIDVVNRKKS